jgi:hypothetical protein
MNDKKEERRNEALIREFAESSKRLRRLEGLRDSNRRCIENALRSPNAEKSAPGWLSRRVSVPFPVAAGFLLIFCLQLTFQCFNLASHFKTPKEMASDKTDSTRLAEEPLQLHYSEQTIYVAGMGFAERLKNYAYFRENDYEDN